VPRYRHGREPAGDRGPCLFDRSGIARRTHELQPPCSAKYRRMGMEHGFAKSAFRRLR
jgi:hypothetical protein